jgi:hypothetical protein
VFGIGYIEGRMEKTLKRMTTKGDAKGRGRAK